MQLNISVAQKCPEITGWLRNSNGNMALFNQSNTQGGGAFVIEQAAYDIYPANATVNVDMGRYNIGTNFSAKRSNSIYTSENLVRPFSTSVKFFIRY